MTTCQSKIDKKGHKFIISYQNLTKCLSSLNIKLSLHLIHFTMTGQTYFSSAESWIIFYSIHFSP